MKACIRHVTGLTFSWALAGVAGALAAVLVAVVPMSKPHLQAALPEPELKSYDQLIPGSTVKFNMVAVPGGKFNMGSPEAEKGRNKDEGPVHEVQVGAFWIG